jgi:hypothetical protein
MDDCLVRVSHGPVELLGLAFDKTELSRLFRQPALAQSTAPFLGRP